MTIDLERLRAHVDFPMIVEDGLRGPGPEPWWYVTEPGHPDIAGRYAAFATEEDATAFRDVFQMLPALLSRLEADARRIAELERTVARIETWTREHGAALKPRGADTYGDGMRDAKEQVRRLLSAPPASDEHEAMGEGREA